MAKAEPGLISREAFKNNVDRLIFADRHEYRTRSRVANVFLGLFCLGVVVAILYFLYWMIIVEGAKRDGTRTIGIVSCLGFVPCAYMFVWFTNNFCRFHPWLVVRPEGVAFRDWPSKSLSLRLRYFTRTFDEIRSVEITKKGMAGDRGNGPLASFYYVELLTTEDFDLRLPWRTNNDIDANQQEINRFRIAFCESLEAMANGPPTLPYR